MIVMPEPKFRVDRSSGCDRWIGSPLGRTPHKSSTLPADAGTPRIARQRLLPVAVFDRGLGGLPISSTPSSDADHALTNRPARISDAGHIPSDGHLPEKSRRLTHPPLQHSS
jgi:hypothetical protein